MDVNSRNILGVKNSDVDPDSVAISPNGDGHYDSAFPYLYFYRNYVYAKYEIVDANDHVIQKSMKKEISVRISLTWIMENGVSMK